MPRERIEDYYVDQQYEYFGRPGYQFFNAYTPYGIQRLDSQYGERIRGGQEDKKELAKEIRKNIHLHKKIKENLLWNLRNRDEKER